MVAAQAVPEIVVRYAEQNDHDVCAIHRFLLLVAPPMAQCPINVIKSLEEVIRVVKDNVALMVFHNGVLVGTMGIVSPQWWYGDEHFMCDRWQFMLPAFVNSPASEEMEAEAVRIAEAAGLKFINFGKIRKAKKGMLRMTPRIFSPAEEG